MPRAGCTLPFRLRRRVHKLARVIVLRIAENLLGYRVLDDFAALHHDNAVGEMANDRQVVGDEDIGKPQPVAQLGEQVDDLDLDRYVQRRDGFIAHDQFGLGGKGPGNRDTLTLAAGKLMRIARRMLRLQSHEPQKLDYAFTPARFGENVLVNTPRLGNDIENRHSRVHGAVGVLKDHLHLAAERQQLFCIHLEDVAAVKQRLSLRDVVEPEEYAGNRRFA